MKSTWRCVIVLLVGLVACGDKQGAIRGRDTCTDKTTSVPGPGSLDFGFCTATECPFGGEDQGGGVVLREICANQLQATCTPCECPHRGVIPTGPEPRCRAGEDNNPADVQFVQSCEYERGNTENPVRGCPPEKPSRCLCKVNIPAGQNIRCRCQCPPLTF